MKISLKKKKKSTRLDKNIDKLNGYLERPQKYADRIGDIVKTALAVFTVGSVVLSIYNLIPKDEKIVIKSKKDCEQTFIDRNRG